MANPISFFQLNTDAKIPSVTLGTWQSNPGLVGEAVATAIKFHSKHKLSALCKCGKCIMWRDG
ncbi:hypothetical protein RGQ29_011780 [Quercus rubra]|uniref:Uncharacterized protein n=1 Tax=Quercus rubra TaxID=3512 RepID=A0AAN7J2E2_QUERU|nr:hypothetical protein RGQ29_011780 [Quercus rubra]